MKIKLLRALLALALALAGAGAGYAYGGSSIPLGPREPAAVVAAPAPGTTRILYSLDAKQNNQELIALINEADSHIYFAIYEFTLKDVADALVAAKKRGVDVRGIVDSGEAAKSYMRPIVTELTAAGIPVETERHSTGNGIMHIKALVTEQAYAIGSYNWTRSATTLNDEILEIGTDPALRQAYEDLLKRLFEKYQGNAAAEAAAPVSIGTIDYREAGGHIGANATVRGTLVEAYTSSTGTVFLDFCKSYKTCPFSGVIFADDVPQFGDLSRYVGTTITVTGTISSYQNKAEIILSDPSQLSK